MSADSNKRRKIEVTGRTFYWSLNHQYGNYWRDYEPPAVSIVSDDHRFEVHYQLRQSSQGNCRLDIRKWFAEIPLQVQTPLYVLVPQWDDEKATTKFVRQLLDWCLDEEKEFSLVSLTVRSKTDDDGFKYMIEQLGGLPKLEELYLRSTSISDTGLQLVSDLPSLTTLYVIKGPTTDTGLKCLESLVNLKSLCLAEIDITDQGLKCLSHLQKLELLWLNETKVSDAGIDDIARLDKLWYIDLTNTLVTVEGRRKLRAALPNSGVHPDD